MNYETKYEKALERASNLKVQNPFDTVGQMVEHIFPELKESEDERIRKALIEMIHDTTGDECEDCYHVSKESVLAWLEKQGEKKNTCKREIDDAYLQGTCDAKHEIEKQGKKLDADNVWLQNYISNVTRLVNQFSNLLNIGKELKGGEL